MLNLIFFAKNEGRLSMSVFAFTSFIIALPLLVIVVWLKADYNRHKKPLLAIDPNVKYTFWHHVKVVSIPLMSYRITFMIQKKNDSHEAHSSSSSEVGDNPANAQQANEQQAESGVNSNSQSVQNIDTSPLSNNVNNTVTGLNIANAQSVNNNDEYRASSNQVSVSYPGSNSDNLSQE